MQTADIILNLWILFSHMEQIHHKEQTVDTKVFRKHTNILGWIVCWISLDIFGLPIPIHSSVLKALCIDYILWFLANQQISPVTKIHFAGLINVILCVRFEVVICSGECYVCDILGCHAMYSVDVYQCFR
jgi:hypothetical protein